MLMKTIKFYLTFISLLLCIFPLLSQDKKNQNPKVGLAEITIEKINKDVQLTDSQKTVLKENFNIRVKKIELASKKLNEKEKFDSKKNAADEFYATLDSILTPIQKEKFKQKQEDRKKN
jgi:galactokinase